jgi:hypothetical protein
MTDNTNTSPSEVYLWIYEKNERVNLEECPYNSGDTQAIEEGIRQLFDCYSPWTGGDVFYETEITCDVTEEGAGIFRCKDADTGKLAPFPADWIEKNLNKRFIINNPDEMEPLLTHYYYPWKHRVEILFTDKSAPTPPMNLPPSEADKLKMSKESQRIQDAINSMSKMGILTEGNQGMVRDILKKLVSEIKSL